MSDDFQVSTIHRTQANRLVLAGLNGDVDAANAVFYEAGEEPDGYIKLAMMVADLAVSITAQTVGVERGREYLLSDLAVLLDEQAADGDDA